jgi:Flp pilus assembly protein TadB
VIFIFLLGCAMAIFLIWYARTLWQHNQKKRRKAIRKKSTPSTRR